MTGFFQSCQDLFQNLFSTQKVSFKGPSYQVPENADPSHIDLIKSFKELDHFPESYPHLPYMEQSLKRFKDTDEYFVEYFMKPGDWNKKGYQDYLENSVEVILFPHSSIHGHIRLRIGKKIYGYENVSVSFNEPFTPERIFKKQRELKRGVKAGNIGVVFVLTEEQKRLLTSRMEDIERFYSSTQKYNVPPFDGKGDKRLKIIQTDDGQYKYHSPTAPSGYGNRAKFNARIVNSEGLTYLEAPNGLRHLVEKDENDELVTQGYSCSSSVGHVLQNYLGLSVKDMPFAGSFFTHLKNGATEHTKPSAIIHYYSSSDL